MGCDRGRARGPCRRRGLRKGGEFGVVGKRLARQVIEETTTAGKLLGDVLDELLVATLGGHAWGPFCLFRDAGRMREPQLGQIAKVAAMAGVPMLAQKSIKAALDLEWSDPTQKSSAIVTLVEQLDRLEAWLRKELTHEIDEPPLSESSRA